ncbi:epithelial cell transforming sequence 2 oncoprotein-like [Balamuthia mandrillaris]
MLSTSGRTSIKEHSLSFAGNEEETASDESPREGTKTKTRYGSLRRPKNVIKGVFSSTDKAELPLDPEDKDAVIKHLMLENKKLLAEVERLNSTSLVLEKSLFSTQDRVAKMLQEATAKDDEITKLKSTVSRLESQLEQLKNNMLNWGHGLDELQQTRGGNQAISPRRRGGYYPPVNPSRVPDDTTTKEAVDGAPPVPPPQLSMAPQKKTVPQNGLGKDLGLLLKKRSRYMSTSEYQKSQSLKGGEIRLAQESEKRSQVVREILLTERNYNTCLAIMIEEYQRPLKTKKWITEEQIKCMFYQLEVIFELNRQLLLKLEERIDRWNDKSVLGDIFLEMADYLRLYKNYLNNYPKALAMIKTLKENKKFVEFLETVRANRKQGSLFSNYELNSFLITPVQRIPRYIILLKTLSQYTPPEHKDHELLKKALHKLEVVADDNERAQELNLNIKRLFQLQKRFSAHSRDVQLVEPHRRILHETNMFLWKIRGGKVHKSAEFKLCFVLIFNDMVLFARKASRYKTVVNKKNGKWKQLRTTFDEEEEEEEDDSFDSMNDDAEDERQQFSNSTNSLLRDNLKRKELLRKEKKALMNNGSSPKGSGITPTSPSSSFISAGGDGAMMSEEAFALSGDELHFMFQMEVEECTISSFATSPSASSNTKTSSPSSREDEGCKAELERIVAASPFRPPGFSVESFLKLAHPQRTLLLCPEDPSTSEKVFKVLKKAIKSKKEDLARRNVRMGSCADGLVHKLNSSS